MATPSPSNPTPKPWEHTKSGEGSAADPLAARFVSSLDYDKRLYKHDIRGSIAHARMLKHVKLINADDLKEIERGLTEIEAEIDQQGDAWPGWKVELEDVHMCVEAALIEKTGDAGRKLHTGRSRNDQVALDLQLWISDAENSLYVKFQDLYRAFILSAEKYGTIVMPSYTHLQRAQPIVVGSELMAWLRAFRLAEDRYGLNDGDHWNCHLGSGAIAGSALPLDRSNTVEQFKNLDHRYEFWEASPNSMFSTAARDKAQDFAFALCMTSMWLSRWAEQWIIYSTTEFGFITLDDLYTTGSSMMPQKQNPDMLELIRGKTGLVYGSLMAAFDHVQGPDHRLQPGPSGRQTPRLRGV
ncbi:MAG: argininosuccinate lyase [Phycisphaerales bacterium]